MKLITITLLLLCFSCQYTESDWTRFDIDPLTQSALDNFSKDALNNSIVIPKNNLIIRIVDGLKQSCDGCLAITQYQSKGTHQIYVFFDRKTWMERPEIRETVFYHEMGHAFLKRTHVVTYSLMNVDVADKGWPDNEKKQQLITELFSKL